ncbi:MAG: type III pantothenate kinase [Bacteroidia bacterium]|nr:type III pantothenate kinase [Bacteroidia bacterium]
MSDILAVDTGNTRTKMALIHSDGTFLKHKICRTPDAPSVAISWLEGHAGPLMLGWLSTSAAWDTQAWAPIAKRLHIQIVQIHPEHGWPFAHDYATPHTLGADRFAGIVAACNLSPAKPVLVVDAGTAITYDVATAEPRYLGGAISPGLQMRYDALHHFTAKLPHLRKEGDAPLIGNSTTQSLKAGVETAIVKEVQGMIDAYRKEMGASLQVFLTGGDALYFEKQLKNVNFADASLVLRGIYFILKHIAST